jgi:hypothetical protein
MKHLWYRFFYRTVMRFAHRYNWHHTTDIGPLDDGSTQKWCTWCGLREVRTRQTTPITKVATPPSRQAP